MFAGGGQVMVGVALFTVTDKVPVAGLLFLSPLYNAEIVYVPAGQASLLPLYTASPATTVTVPNAVPFFWKLTVPLGDCPSLIAAVKMDVPP
jgi:hypothetical protein